MRTFIFIITLLSNFAICAEEINFDNGRLDNFDYTRPIDVCDCQEITDLTSTVLPALEGVYRNQVILNGSQEDYEGNLLRLSKLELLNQIQKDAQSGFALGSCSEAQEDNNLIAKVKNDYGIESEMVLPMLNPPALNPRVLQLIVDEKRILIYRGEINGNEVVFFLDSNVNGAPRLRYLEQEIPTPQFGTDSRVVGNRIIYTDLASGEDFGVISQSGNRISLSFGQETDNGDQLELKGNLSGITPEGEQQQDVDGETSLTYTSPTQMGDLQFGIESEVELDADANQNGTQTYQGQGVGFIGYRFSNENFQIDNRQDIASTDGEIESETNARLRFNLNDNVEVGANARMENYELVGESLTASIEEGKSEAEIVLNYESTEFETGTSNFGQGIGENSEINAELMWDTEGLVSEQYGLSAMIDSETKLIANSDFSDGTFEEYDFGLLSQFDETTSHRFSLHGEDDMAIERIGFSILGDEVQDSRKYVFTNEFNLRDNIVSLNLDQGEYGDSDSYGLELSQNDGTTIDYGQTRTISEGTITANDFRVNDEFLTLGTGIARESTWGDRTNHFGCQVSMTAISENSTASPSSSNLLRGPSSFTRGSSTTCGLDVSLRGMEVERTTARVARDYRLSESGSVSMYMEADTLFGGDTTSRELSSVGIGISGQIKF